MDENQKEEIKQNISDTNMWIKILFVVLYTVVYVLAKYLVLVLVIINGVANLLTGRDLDRISTFAKQLNLFIYTCLEYITFVSDTKPFPFLDWASKEKAEAVHDFVADKQAD